MSTKPMKPLPKPQPQAKVDLSQAETKTNRKTLREYLKSGAIISCPDISSVEHGT